MPEVISGIRKLLLQPIKEYIMLDELQALLIIQEYIELTTVEGTEPKILKVALRKLDDKLNPKMLGEKGEGSQPDEVILSAAEAQSVEWDKDLLDFIEELQEDVAKIPDLRPRVIRLDRELRDLRQRHAETDRNLAELCQVLRRQEIRVEEDIPF